MRDFIEQLEDSAERQYQEGSISINQFKCSCGAVFAPEKEGGFISPNPYAMPVCGECLANAMMKAREE